MSNETYTVKVDDAPDLRFEGDLLASVRSDTYGGYWTVLSLYRTKAGKYICSEENYTMWQGESDSHNTDICDDLDDVIGFFGQSRLAKELYESAGIENVTNID